MLFDIVVNNLLGEINMFKTSTGQIIDVEEITWKQASELLRPIAPELTAIIDRISPSDEYTLFRAKYPFGVKVIDKHKTFLPLKDSGLISFNNKSLPTILSEKLGYNPTFQNPMGIVLDKRSEFYFSTDRRIIPYAVIKPGDVFGTGRILENLSVNPLPDSSFFLWELTSGVRNIFMLPKISRETSYRSLKQYCGLESRMPQNYSEHWGVFGEICDKLKPDWHSEFLFFSNKWIESLKLPEFSELYIFLLHESYTSYRFWRNLPSWQIALNIVENLKGVINSSPYLLNTAKHLFMIASGDAVGFRPATDENFAPVKFLQDLYVNIYNIEENMPTIMHADHFSFGSGDPIYYSLNHPTLIQNYTSDHSNKSLLSLLGELQYIMGRYKAGIHDSEVAQATSLYNITKNIEFTYYHSSPEKYTTIKSCSAIPAEDKRFLYKSKNKKWEFAKNGAFVKSCIKIGHNKIFG